MPPRALATALSSLALGTLLAGCGTGGDAGATPDPTHTEAPGETTESCGELDGIIERIECFADRASEAGDRSRCDEASEDAVRYQCYAIYAERRGDPAACRAIPSGSEEHRQLRDACLGDVAPVLAQADLCEEITTPGLRDSCYLAVFEKTGDAELCDRIEDPGLRSACTGEPVHVE